MSRIDPECFPQASFSAERVCTGCINDEDLKRLIRDVGGGRGCSYCGRRSAPTAPVSEVASFIGERMGTFYGRAVDQRPYISRDGGYQGWHLDTEDLLFGTIGLDLPRDRDGALKRAILGKIGDDAWCEFDWLRLEMDESYRTDWERFCKTVKHRRRFFFHQSGAENSHDPDGRSLHEFLVDFGKLIDTLGHIRTAPRGYALYRARARRPGVRFRNAAELGPPPAEYTTQSNRMNPSGIPMFYGAESRALACAEARQPLISVGKFIAERPVRLLDLATMAPVPGFFSRATREQRLGSKFLHAFARQITDPVAGDDRTHIEYIPTQVFTEFLRDFPFRGGPIDGLRYLSATGVPGANVVLFATQDNVSAGDVHVANASQIWLRLAGVSHSELAESPRS